MLVPNILLQFPNQELLSSVGTFISYNIGYRVLRPDVSPPREVPGRISPSFAGAQVHVLLCTAWNPEADGVGPGGPSGPSGSSSGQCWRGRVSRQPI